jgi:nucleotide-binding universal stress UspA family protein
MISRILVPTDFGDASEAALAYGREIADRFTAALHLIHIGENPFLRAAVADRRSLEEAPVRWLQGRLTETDRDGEPSRSWNNLTNQQRRFFDTRSRPTSTSS